MGEEYNYKSVFSEITRMLANGENPEYFKSIAALQALNKSLEKATDEKPVEKEVDEICKEFELWEKLDGKDNNEFLKQVNIMLCNLLYRLPVELNPKDALIFLSEYFGNYTDITEKYNAREFRSLTVNTNYVIESIDNVMKTNIQDVKKKTEDVLKYVQNAKTTIDNLVGVASNNVNAGKYLEYSKKCKSSAFWLFWLSIAIMFSVAMIAGVHLWFFDKFEMLVVIGRMPLAFLILLPSFFMMRESKKLKDKEFQYHDMACRIITSAPYIDGLTNLDNKKKDEMKAELVKDFFARPMDYHDDGGLVPVSEICEIVKACSGVRK